MGEAGRSEVQKEGVRDMWNKLRMMFCKPRIRKLTESEITNLVERISHTKPGGITYVSSDELHYLATKKN